MHSEPDGRQLQRLTFYFFFLYSNRKREKLAFNQELSFYTYFKVM
jgi:hypothetical protein